MIAATIWFTAALLYLVFWACMWALRGNYPPSEVENYIKDFQIAEPLRNSCKIFVISLSMMMVKSGLWSMQ